MAVPGLIGINEEIRFQLTSTLSSRLDIVINEEIRFQLTSTLSSRLDIHNHLRQCVVKLYHLVCNLLVIDNLKTIEYFKCVKVQLQARSLCVTCI